MITSKMRNDKQIELSLERAAKYGNRSSLLTQPFMRPKSAMESSISALGRLK